MKKSLIALAAVAAAGAATAQSSVTLFGVVDAAFQRVSSETATGDVSTTRLASGSNRTSRLGFRGVEDLGGGLKATFWLEAGVAVDSGAAASTNILTNNQPGTAVGSGALAFNRRATLGLSGKFGEIRIGRDSVQSLLAQESFDPYDANGVGSLRQVVFANAQVVNGAALANVTGFGLVRASNMVEYFTPNFGGFTASVGYALNENPSNAGATEDNGKLLTLRGDYKNGPLTITAAGTTIDFNTGDYKDYTIGASYNFGVVKPSIAFHRNEIDRPTAEPSNVIILGLTAPLGNGLLRAAYARTDQKGSGAAVSSVAASRNNDGDIFAIGYIYNMSKRTSLYSTYARSKNKNGSTLFTVGGASAAAANQKTTGFEFGVTHAF